MSDQAGERSRIICGLAGMVNFNPVAASIGASLASMSAHAAQGINSFDMGDIYPGVEEQAGAFVRQHFGTAAGAAAGRDSLRLLTKYVPNKKSLASIDEAEVGRLVRRCCNRLGVDALDCVQLHWWDYDAPGMLRVGLALTALRDAGLVRSIGVTNTDTDRLRELLEGGVPVEVVQVQYSLIDRRPAAQLAPYCVQLNGAGGGGGGTIGILCYGVLCGGFCELF